MRLSGSITALATPFTAAGGIDFDAWRRLLERQLSAGTAVLVVAGSTGEASALSAAEFDALLGEAVALAGGKVPVLAGTGASATARTIEQTRRAREAGADGALVVTPPYVRPTQDGLLAHYRAVAEDGGLPVVLYNVPGRTGCDLLPETVAALAPHPGIVGIKEAVGEAGRIQALLPLRGPGFALLSGDDPTCAGAMAGGADGVVSVASNVAPAAMRRLCELARGGDSARTADWERRLRPLFDFLGLAPNPIPLKALLRASGIGHGLRLPLTPLPDAHADQVAAMAAGIDALELSCRDTLAA